MRMFDEFRQVTMGLEFSTAQLRGEKLDRVWVRARRKADDAVEDACLGFQRDDQCRRKENPSAARSGPSAQDALRASPADV